MLVAEYRNFRGLTKDGRWIYGDKVQVGNTCWIVSRPEVSENDDMRERYHSIWGFIEVDPKTVGQFTGLKDKNGTEIYEGDKIKFGNNKFWCAIVWNDKGFYQLWRNGMVNWTLWIDDYYHNSGSRKDLEVIGNIHQPNLLGDQDNESN